MPKNMTADNKKDIDLGDSEQVYDRDAEAFATKAPTLMTWEYIGAPTIRATLHDFLEGKDASTISARVEGSASGRDVEQIVGQGVPEENIVGIEVSGEEIKKAEAKFPRATFIKGDIAKVETARQFDFALRSMVTEFLKDGQLEEADQKTFDSLKPGGVFLDITIAPARITAKRGVSQRGPFLTNGPWAQDPDKEKFENWYRNIPDRVRSLRDAGFTVEDEEVRELYMPQEALDKYPDKFDYPDVPARLAIVAHKPE